MRASEEIGASKELEADKMVGVDRELGAYGDVCFYKGVGAGKRSYSGNKSRRLWT